MSKCLFLFISRKCYKCLEVCVLQIAIALSSKLQILTHHHKPSTAGHRPPPSVATKTGPMILATSGFLPLNQVGGLPFLIYLLRHFANEPDSSSLNIRCDRGQMPVLSMNKKKHVDYQTFFLNGQETYHNNRVPRNNISFANCQ